MHDMPHREVYKRLTFISKHTGTITDHDLAHIQHRGGEKNMQLGISSVLVCLRGLFFQVLEGEKNVVDAVFRKICADRRHTDILVLKMETREFFTDPEDDHEILIGEGDGRRVTLASAVQQWRMFPQEYMKVIDLRHPRVKSPDVPVLVDEVAGDIDDESPAGTMVLIAIRSLLTTVAESHRVLERYAQKTVFKLLQSGINPLKIPVIRVKRLVLFADIVSFTAISEVLTPEQLVSFVNDFFTLASNIVHSHGGEISKYIGDCVLAYFDATNEGVENALLASVEILKMLELERQRGFAQEMHERRHSEPVVLSASSRDRHDSVVHRRHSDMTVLYGEDENDAASYTPKSGYQDLPANNLNLCMYAGIGLALGYVVQGNVGCSFKVSSCITHIER